MAELTPEKKKKLREILEGMATPEELETLKKSDANKLFGKQIDAIVKAVEDLTEDGEKARNGMTNIALMIEGNKKQVPIMGQKIVSAFGEFAKILVNKLDEVKEGYQGSRGQGDYALTFQNIAKSIADGLTAVKDSVDKKPVPVWRWPQYLYSGIRNTQFQPVDPAVDSMNLGEYDYVTMELSAGDTTENYTFKKGGASGTTTGLVVIVYTDDTREVLVSVTKTPHVSQG